jgi:porphobilinogen synthase
LFVVPGKRRREAVSAMPGVERISADLLARRAEAIRSSAVMIFGVPDASDKDERASAAVREDSLVPAAVRALKAKRPDLIVMTDLCLCGYTSHGHCGILAASGEVDNDATLEVLAGMAKAYAAAGADMVAPSAMADGQVRAIRDALDEGGFHPVAVMSYAAKFASSFYGPFREAAHSTPAFGDRRSYQLPPANRREAIRDALMDEAEGADWLMVKPAMPYLDVLAELRTATRRPVAAYQVSGEYAMLKFAGAASALDEKAAALEAALCIRRAGADAIITYYAEQLVQWIAV